MTDGDGIRAERRTNEPHHEQTFAATTALKNEVVKQDRAARRRAAPWVAITLTGASIFGGLFAFQLDTRSVATGSTACSRGDSDACRASADRIANACSPVAISRAADPFRAAAQCRNLARALEPLQRVP